MLKFNNEQKENIWIVSDWHFSHDREFVYKPRGFNSIDEMNEAIIERHNSVVKKDDIVFCLGDCMLGDNEKGLECIKRLNGKIYIIPGNHCTNRRIELYKTLPNVTVLGYADILKYKGYHFYLSHYQTITSNYDDDKPLKGRIWSIHGHTHSIEKFSSNYPCCYNICLDAHNCQPVLLDEIIKDINNYHNFQGQK